VRVKKRSLSINEYVLSVAYQPLSAPVQQLPSVSNTHQYPTVADVRLPSVQTPLLNYIRTRRQYFQGSLPSPAAVFAQNLVKQARIKLLNLPNLTCQDQIEPNTHRSLFDLNSSTSVCSYTKHCPSTCNCCSSSTIQMLHSRLDCHCFDQCPTECSCKRSFDLTKNYVNCSHRDLHRLPMFLPTSMTHLNLDNNQLQSFENNFTLLTNLRVLSLKHNRFESLSNNEFVGMPKIEDLDLSSNICQYV
jgi:hypothetical protein